MNQGITRVKVLSGGIFALVLAMGVARFSYTPLLPLMQRQANLGLSEGAWLAAVNYMGYLSGAVAASLVSDQGLKIRLYLVGMALCIVTTAMMGISSNVLTWLLSRYLAGLGTAACMLMGTGLILNWLMRNKHRSELGVHFAGVGVGIAVCSAAVAWMTPALDWREQWFAFTVLGILLAIPAVMWMPDTAVATGTQKAETLEARLPGRTYLGVFMAAYFCAGVGYVVSATFIVSIIDGLPGMKGQGALVFFLIGIAGAPSCFLWDLVARRTGDLNAVILASILQIFGIILPIWPGGLLAALLGSIFFGATVMGLVSLVLTMAGRYQPAHPAKMLGRMSIAYGSGQILGPLAAGVLGSASGNYNNALYMAAGVMVAGTILLFVLRGMEHREA